MREINRTLARLERQYGVRADTQADRFIESLGLDPEEYKTAGGYDVNRALNDTALTDWKDDTGDTPKITKPNGTQKN